MLIIKFNASFVLKLHNYINNFILYKYSDNTHIREILNFDYLSVRR